MRRSSKPLPKDPNHLAYEAARCYTEKVAELEISKYQAKIGRKGGKSRADKLTATQRRRIAIKAAHARWKKKQ